MTQTLTGDKERAPTIPSSSDPKDSPRAFVSYARENEEFARLLATSLESQSVVIRADWLLEPGPDYRQQLRQLILASDVFVFVITDESVSSPECAHEIAIAEELGKRIQPVLHRDPPDATALPAYVRVPQWAIIRSLPENDAELQRLEASIKTDFSLVQMHTFLLQRAEHWQRTNGGLLRGPELKEAEAWLPLAADSRHLPNPTPLQSKFILASRKNRARTYQIVGGTAIAVAAAISVAAWIAWQNARIAQSQGELARQAGLTAQREASRATAAGLAAQSRDLLARAPRQLPRATLLALEAVKRDISLETDGALRAAVELLPTRRSEVVSESPVFALDVSRDGQLVAAGSDDSHFRVWRIDDLRTPIMQGKHDGAVNVVAFSPDGQYLATGSRNAFSFGDSPPDNTARIWSVASGRQLLRVLMESGVSVIKFSPNRRFVAIAPRSGPTRVWRMPSMIELAAIPATITNAVDFSPDGRRLAITSNYDVELWDVNAHRRIARLPHNGGVEEVVFSPDGMLVATVARDFKIRIWHATPTIATSEPQQSTEAAGVPVRGLPSGIRFSPSGRYVATRHETDFSVRIWAVEQTAVGIYLREVNRIRAAEPLNAAEFGSDDARILTAGSDGTGRVWDTFTGRELSRAYHDASVEAIRTPDNGHVFVTSGLDGKVRVWESNISRLTSRTPEGPLWRPEPLYGAADTVEFVASSQSNKYQLLGTSQSGVQLWESQATPRLVRVVRNGDQARVLTAAFGGDERSAVVVTDRSVEFLQWTGDSARPVSAQRCCEGTRRQEATLSFDGNVAAIAANDLVEVWDLRQRKLVAKKSFASEIVALAFAPTAETLVVGERGRASLWSWSGGESRDVPGAAYNVAFADERRLAVADGESVSVWDLQTAPPIRLARLVFDSPAGLTFAGQSRLLAVVGGNPSATAATFPAVIWNWSTGASREQARIELPRPGSAVATVGDDHVMVAMVAGGAQVVPVAIETVRTAACGRLIANFSTAEWLDHLPAPRQQTCANLP